MLNPAAIAVASLLVVNLFIPGERIGFAPPPPGGPGGGVGAALVTTNGTEAMLDRVAQVRDSHFLFSALMHHIAQLLTSPANQGPWGGAWTTLNL